MNTTATLPRETGMSLTALAERILAMSLAGPRHVLITAPTQTEARNRLDQLLFELPAGAITKTRRTEGSAWVELFNGYTTIRTLGRFNRHAFRNRALDVAVIDNELSPSDERVLSHALLARGGTLISVHEWNRKIGVDA